MMSVIAGAKSTKIQMLAYTLILLPLAMAPVFFVMAYPVYGIGAAILSLFFIYTAGTVLRHETIRYARRMFGYSIFYLFALFTLLILQHV